MKNTKLMITLVMGIFMMLILAACGDSNSEGNAEENGETRLKIAAGNSGGTYYYIGAGIASILGDKDPSLTVTTEATSGAPAENLAFVNQDPNTLGLSTLDGVYNAVQGNEDLGFPKPYDNLGIIMAGHQLTFYITALASSGIEEIEDMADKTVALPPLGSTAYNQATATLEEYGLVSDEDYTATFLTYSEMADALKDGAIDVAIIGGGVPAASVTDLTYTNDVNILKISDEVLTAVQEQNQYWSIGEIPANTYEGQDEVLKTLNAPVVLVVNTEMSEEIAGNIREILFDSNKEFEEIHVEGVNWSKESTEAIVDLTDIPFYPPLK